MLDGYQHHVRHSMLSGAAEVLGHARGPGAVVDLDLVAGELLVVGLQALHEALHAHIHRRLEVALHDVEVKQHARVRERRIDAGRVGAMPGEMSAVRSAHLAPIGLNDWRTALSRALSASVPLRLAAITRPRRCGAARGAAAPRWDRWM